MSSMDNDASRIEEVRQAVIKEVFTTPGKILVLMILALKGEAHGYELLKEIENITLGFWKPSHSYLYSLLNKLVRDGLLKAKEEYKGKVRRVKYSLTRKGLERLAVSNSTVIRILYTMLRYHELVGRKIEKIVGSEQRLSEDVIKEYLELLKQLRVILDERINKLEEALKAKQSLKNTHG